MGATPADLPVATGIDIAQAYATAFFSAHLLGDASGARYPEEPRPTDGISLEVHP